MNNQDKKTMLDYIASCPAFIRDNVARSAELTQPLVDEFVSGGYQNIWIVACGSSANGALCARQFVRRCLGCEVKLVSLCRASMISRPATWSSSSARADTA